MYETAYNDGHWCPLYTSNSAVKYMIYMQVILDMNDILIFEDGFVIESCDFLIILLKIYFTSIVGIHACTNAFLFFYLH